MSMPDGIQHHQGVGRFRTGKQTVAIRQIHRRQPGRLQRALHDGGFSTGLNQNGYICGLYRSLTELRLSEQTHHFSGQLFGQTLAGGAFAGTVLFIRLIGNKGQSAAV